MVPRNRRPERQRFLDVLVDVAGSRTGAKLWRWRAPAFVFNGSASRPTRAAPSDSFPRSSCDGKRNCLPRCCLIPSAYTELTALWYYVEPRKAPPPSTPSLSSTCMDFVCRKEAVFYTRRNRGNLPLGCLMPQTYGFRRNAVVQKT